MEIILPHPDVHLTWNQALQMKNQGYFRAFKLNLHSPSSPPKEIFSCIEVIWEIPLPDMIPESMWPLKMATHLNMFSLDFGRANVCMELRNSCSRIILVNKTVKYFIGLQCMISSGSIPDGLPIKQRGHYLLVKPKLVGSKKVASILTIQNNWAVLVTI